MNSDNFGGGVEPEFLEDSFELGMPRRVASTNKKPVIRPPVVTEPPKAPPPKSPSRTVKVKRAPKREPLPVPVPTPAPVFRPEQPNRTEPPKHERSAAEKRNHRFTVFLIVVMIILGTIIAAEATFIIGQNL